jgi:hypothetical protein
METGKLRISTADVVPAVRVELAVPVALVAPEDPAVPVALVAPEDPAVPVV